MQREILFRGKRIDNGEWMEGDLVKRISKNGDRFFIHADSLFLEHEAVMPEVVAKTIGQATTKKSTIGKTVYEGDIRREEIEEDDGDRRYFYVCVYLSEWECFSWLTGDELEDYQANGIVGLDTQMRYTFLMEETENIVICGNIHDNPGLLK